MRLFRAIIQVPCRCVVLVVICFEVMDRRLFRREPNCPPFRSIISLPVPRLLPWTPSAPPSSYRASVRGPHRHRRRRRPIAPIGTAVGTTVVPVSASFLTVGARATGCVHAANGAGRTIESRLRLTKRLPPVSILSRSIGKWLHGIGFSVDIDFSVEMIPTRDASRPRPWLELKF